jgi:hypothetical protein
MSSVARTFWFCVICFWQFEQADVFQVHWPSGGAL